MRVSLFRPLFRPVFLLAPLLLALTAGLAGCQSVQETGPAAPAAAAPPTATITPLPAPASPAATSPAAPLPPAAQTASVRIGLLLPLTGSNAAIGRALLDAAELALFDSGNASIALLPYDTTSEPAGAATAAAAALGQGAEIIIGPLTAGATKAVAPLAQPRSIPVLSFSSDSSVAGTGVYILGFTPEQQVAEVVRYARAQGLNTFAALLPENPYGTVIAGAYKTALQKEGGTLAKLVTYPADQPDLTSAVEQLAGHGPLRAAGNNPHADATLTQEDARLTPPFQALLLAEGGGRLKALAPLLPYYAIDPDKVRFLGTGLWDVPDLGREPTLVGGWYAASPPADTAAFAKRFAAAYGHPPPRIASLGYDAIALAAALAKTPGPAIFSAQALSNPNGFSGYDGIFRFGADGVAERGLAILEVEADGVKVVQPAPASFQPATN